MVDVATDGEQALRTVRPTDYEAIVLDVAMPGLDGFETCGRPRADGVWAPVLMLTARDAVGDRVRRRPRTPDRVPPHSCIGGKPAATC